MENLLERQQQGEAEDGHWEYGTKVEVIMKEWNIDISQASYGMRHALDLFFVDAN